MQKPSIWLHEQLAWSLVSILFYDDDDGHDDDNTCMHDTFHYLIGKRHSYKSRGNNRDRRV